MRRHEAVTLLAVALLLIVAGSVWLLKAWGLLGAGVVLAVIVLFVVNIEDPDRKRE